MEAKMGENKKWKCKTSLWSIEGAPSITCGAKRGPHLASQSWSFFTYLLLRFNWKIKTKERSAGRKEDDGNWTDGGGVWADSGNLADGGPRADGWPRADGGPRADGFKKIKKKEN